MAIEHELLHNSNIILEDLAEIKNYIIYIKEKEYEHFRKLSNKMNNNHRYDKITYFPKPSSDEEDESVEITDPMEIKFLNLQSVVTDTNERIHLVAKDILRIIRDNDIVCSDLKARIKDLDFERLLGFGIINQLIKDFKDELPGKKST